VPTAAKPAAHVVDHRAPGIECYVGGVRGRVFHSPFGSLFSLRPLRFTSPAYGIAAMIASAISLVPTAVGSSRWGFMS
jgi:hypothetical protein